MAYKKEQKALGLFSLEKGDLRGDLPVLFGNIIEEGYRRGGVKLFSEECKWSEVVTREVLV